METCRDIIDLLSQYLDGDLPREKLDAFEAHMNICPPCVEFLESLRETRSLVRSLTCEEIPVNVRKMLRSFLDRDIKGREP